MSLTFFIKRSTGKLAARALKPLKKGDPEAGKPVYIDGHRVFPPVEDELGRVTYHYEFPEEWKPYSFNYTGHGYMLAS